MIMPRHRPCTNFIHHPSTRTYPSSSAAKPSRTKIAFRRRRLRLRLPKHQEMDGVHGVFPSEQASIDEKHHNKKRKWAPPVSQFLKLPNKLISGVPDLDRCMLRFYPNSQPQGSSRSRWFGYGSKYQNQNWRFEHFCGLLGTLWLPLNQC